MPCIYVIQSITSEKFYIGSSREDAADTRLKSHNSGKTRSTKAGRPWKLVYSERIDDYTQARRRELFLKSGQGRKWLRDNVTSAEGWQSG